MKEFKEKLKELMEEHNNISPEKLEKELENMNLFVSANAIRGYLKGKFPQNMEYYLNLAKYFNVSPMYLIDNKVLNRNCNNIDIGKKLELSDKALDKIKNVSNKKMQNYFFETFQYENFIKDLDLYYKIQRILNYDLKLILYICDIWEYIVDRNNKNKQEELREYFDKCDNAVVNIIHFTDNTIFFDPSDSKYELFRDEYRLVKNDIFNGKLELGDGKLEGLIDLFEEIHQKYKMYSKIIKLNITDNINKYLYAYEKMYDISLGSEDYAKMFGKYIKHINSDIREDYKFYSKRFKMNEIL